MINYLIKWIKQDLKNKFPDTKVCRDAQFFPTKNGYVYTCKNCDTLLSLEAFLRKYFPERVESYRNLFTINTGENNDLLERAMKRVQEKESKRQSSSS